MTVGLACPGSNPGPATREDSPWPASTVTG